MAKVNLWFIGVIIVLLILWYIFVPSNDDSREFFNDIKPKVHAKLNKDCGVEYYSWQSPRQNGEDGCASVPCPKNIDDNVTCWVCCNY